MSVKRDGRQATGRRWTSAELHATMVPVARRLSDVVAARLQELIHEGKIAPGEKLPPERELAATFGVSRSSMREALNQLALQGLIDQHPGRGTVVLDRQSSDHNSALRSLGGLGADVSDAVDFRAVIEPAVTALAARRATRADLIRLQEVVRFMEHEESPATFVTLHRQFHDLIARSCHNPLLVALNGLVGEWMEATRREVLQTQARRALARLGHRAVFRAIAERDPDAAAAAMARHHWDV